MAKEKIAEQNHKEQKKIQPAELNKEESNKPNQKSDAEELAEIKDLLLRTQANFENYRKQMQKRMEEMQELAAKDIILSVLPLFDNLELALKHVDAQNPDDFIKGVTLISTQFNAFLEQQEITTIPTIGNTFDPFLHEAILKAPSGKTENTILEEYQKGFLMCGKVIRHAKVKVSAGKKEEIKDTEKKDSPKKPLKTE